MRRTIVIAALTLGLWVTQATAGSRAWRAAKTHLPSTTTMIVGIDASAWVKSSMFTPLYDMVANEHADVKQVRDMLIAECGVDVVTAIDSIVFASERDGAGGAAYIAIAGAHAKKVERCFTSWTSRGSTPEIQVKRRGPVVEIADGSETAYVGWLGNVVIWPVHRTDQGELKKWMGAARGLSKAPVKPVLDRVDTSAAFWVASTQPKAIGAHGTAVRLAATVALRKGDMVSDVRFTMPDATQAAAIASELNGQLSQVSGLASSSPAAGRILNGVIVQASAGDVMVRSTAAQSDVVSIVKTFGPMLMR
ncbi:MAG: hypothetical protein AB7P03_01610 [Kofleriaceae bacterium]